MPPKSKRRPSPEREARRSEILAAATALFAEKSIDQITFGEIAAKAGLSRPLVYFYFPDLETIFLEAVILACDTMHRMFVASVRAEDKGLDQVRAIGTAYVTFSQQYPQYFGLMARYESSRLQGDKYQDLEARCQHYHQTMMGLIITCLRKGMKDGSVSKSIGDPGKVAVALWALTFGLVTVASEPVEELEESLGFKFSELPEFGLNLISRSLAGKR
jgi:TetR/AcrR family transcriptional regulator